MKSPGQIYQINKEKEVFDAFSSFYCLGTIRQIEGKENSYPDGVLLQNGQEIAIEQTDYYYYKTGKASSYKKTQNMLLRIGKQLSSIGYKGCLGIRLNEKVYSLYERNIYSSLLISIQKYIDNPNCYELNPLIEKIHFCPEGRNELVIKDYACDSSSFEFGKIILPEDLVAERIREKEIKLKKCDKPFCQHWLIISIPFAEHVVVDTRENKPIKTLFDKVFIHYDNLFEELETEKP